MSRYVKLETGAYCNANYILSVSTVFDNTDWRILVDYEPGGSTYAEGGWASEADAVSALEKVFETVNPSNY